MQDEKNRPQKLSKHTHKKAKTKPKAQEKKRNKKKRDKKKLEKKANTKTKQKHIKTKTHQNKTGTKRNGTKNMKKKQVSTNQRSVVCEPGKSVVPHGNLGTNRSGQPGADTTKKRGPSPPLPLTSPPNPPTRRQLPS